MKTHEEFSEEEVVGVFNSTVSGSHGSQSRWGVGSATTFRMYLNQIRKRKHARQNNNKS